MAQRLLVIILIILVCAGWVWNLAQWNLLQQRLDMLEVGSFGLRGEKKEAAISGDVASSSYDITVDMWQIFEQELQDYKQRLREGKQQFDNQRSVWQKLMTDTKKNIQEYDRVLAAEGEFWEKQLKNYEKLVARNEQRLETLEQVVYDLKHVVNDVQQQWDTRAMKELERVAGEEERIEKEVSKPKRIGERISPRIQGAGDSGYKTYPPVEEQEDDDSERIGEVIRGSVTGSGDYTTY